MYSRTQSAADALLLPLMPAALVSAGASVTQAAAGASVTQAAAGASVTQAAAGAPAEAGPGDDDLGRAIAASCDASPY